MTDLNVRTLDLNLLRVFDEVMTERSLTRAARKIGRASCRERVLWYV